MKRCFRCGDDNELGLTEVVKSFGAWTVCPGCRSQLFPFCSAWHAYRASIALWDHDRVCRFRKIGVPITATVQPGRGANGGAHMQFKLSAVAWLQARGIRHYEMERAYPGGIADIRVLDRRIAVECGNISKAEINIIHAVEAGWAVLWMPYGFNDRQGDVVDALMILSPLHRVSARASVATAGCYTHARPPNRTVANLSLHLKP